MSKQLSIFIISLFSLFLISNPILTFDTNPGENTSEIRRIDSAESIASPERTVPAPTSPISTVAPSPDAPTPDCVSRLDFGTDRAEAAAATEKTSLTTRDLAAIDWDIILLNTPESLLVRKEFAKYYKSASQANNSQFLAELITQVYRQIEWTVSTAAGDNRLAPTEISTAVCQLKHICGNGDAVYSNDCCVGYYDKHAVQQVYSVDRWQEIPIPCAKHFGSDELGQDIANFRLLAFINQKTHDIAQLNPETVSRRIISLCDNYACRLLRIHMLAQRHVTSDNIAWLQRTVSDKFCTVAKPISLDTRAADLEDGADSDHDDLCHTEWTILLA